MPSQTSAEKQVMLIVTLSPTDCIPTAMAIQAHMPDNVLILKTRFSREEPLKESENETRLESWLKGADELISTFDDLNEPFPVPISRPRGFTPRGPSPNVNWLSCHVDDIFSIIEEKCEAWPGEVRVDILPGAKDPLIPSLLGSTSNPYSLWYTLEDGKAVNLGSGKRGEVIDGMHLSIVDRAWLSGYPVHVQEERFEPPNPESLEMYRDICASLHLELPGGREKKRKSKLFDLPFSIVPVEFSTGLEELGYRVTKQFKEGDAENSGEFLSVSKGSVACELHQKYPPDSGLGKPGYWLEPIVNSLLWGHWDPVSTAEGVSLIEPTAELRFASFERLWRRGFDDLNSDHLQSDHLSRYLAECDRLSLPHDCDFSDFIQLSIDSMKSSGRSTNERLRYIRITEIDSILLDKFGVSTFDSKVLLADKSSSYLPLQKAMQLAKWIKGGQHIVISSSSPPLDAGDLSSVIHLQRMSHGRRSLLDEEGFLPKPLPDFLIDTRKMNWSGEASQTFELPEVRIQFVPPSMITPLVGSTGPEIGLLVCDDIASSVVLSRMKKYGYIPEEVPQITKPAYKDVGLRAWGKNRKTGLKIMTRGFGRRIIYFSTVILGSKRYTMSIESLSRLIEQKLSLLPHVKSDILFLETEEEHPTLDLLEALQKITEEE